MCIRDRYYDTTRIIIYSLKEGVAIPAGTSEFMEIKYSGDSPHLVSAEAAGYYGEKINLTKKETTIPSNPVLRQNYPNPFNASTDIEFSLPRQYNWRLEIYNINGRKVQSFDGSDPAGPVIVSWDGTDGNGMGVASGVYFYKLSLGEYSETKKMLLLK